jgi:hypothetical protein
MLISPDGVYYLRAAEGLLVPKPYSRRWLLPWLLGPHPYRWAALTYASLAATPLIAWCFFGSLGFDLTHRAFATLLLCALPGVWRCSLRFPVLLDAFSFALALAVATLMRSGNTGAAVLLSMVLGATRETGPVFAALWAWNPLPLLGLLAVGWLRRAAPPDAPHLAHPIKSALALRRTLGLDGSLYVWPWGAALAGLAIPSRGLALTILWAHAQLLIAVDTIRLTVWCAPVLVAAAVNVVPVQLAFLAVVLTMTRQDSRV